MVDPHEAVGRLLEEVGRAQPPSHLQLGLGVPLQDGGQPFLLGAEQVATPQAGDFDE